MTVACSIIVAQGESLSPKEILDKAKAVSDNTTLTAESEDGELKIQFFQKLNPDGTVFKRSDYRSTLGDSTSIINMSGEYQIYHQNKRIIKSTPNILSIMPDFSNDSEYSVQSKTINGFDYYVVTQKIKLSPEVLEKFYAAIPESILKLAPDMKERMLESFPVSTKYYIGKNDFFIYSNETFLRYGKLKSRFTYKNVRFNPMIDDALFQIPRGYKMDIANTFDEYNEKDRVITNEIIDSSIAVSSRSPELHKEGIFSLAGQWVLQKSRIISHILFWSAILVLAGIVIYKIKHK